MRGGSKGRLREGKQLSTPECASSGASFWRYMASKASARSKATLPPPLYGAGQRVNSETVTGARDLGWFRATVK